MYNGNISETSWRTSSDNIRRKYEYVYDGLDRLTDAWFGIPGSVLNVRNSYNEHLNYDLNGNITSLQRNGDTEDASTVIMIDDLTYTYNTNSNKLVSVTDATNHPSGFTPSSTPLLQDAYEYDAFGNLTKDRHKSITNIIYNHLHQPKELFVSNGAHTGSISYLYDANGRKLQKQVMENQQLRTTDYLGTSTSLSTSTFQYLDGSLDFVHRPEGYVKAVHTGSATEYHYVYNYTDHLGNIRLSYGRDPETGDVAILKESHYYPFGLQHNGYVGNHNIFSFGPAQGGKVNLIPVRNYLDDSYRYTFGGKEEQPELGLNWIDHHARNYMPDLGKWMNVDPMADVVPDWTPYRYGFNNPMRFVDPTGMLEEKKDPPKSLNESNPIQLDEVVLKGPQKKSQPKSGKISFSGVMPDYLRHGQPLTWNSPYNPGTLDQYNQDHNTNYTEGNQWNQWYYEYFYKREFDAHIADIHSALHTAAELTMYIMPTPLAGGTLLTKAPMLYRSAKVSTGGVKQWMRFAGNSYSTSGKFPTFGTRWGAGGKHYKKIGNPTLQKWNRSLRQTKLPGDNWRVQDPGHFHWYKKK